MQIHTETHPSFELWHSPSPIDYAAALKMMEAQVEKIERAQAPSTLWFLQHAPVYTSGKRTEEKDKKDLPPNAPIHPVGRGGKLTYHGPGQLVGYFMNDLRTQKDIHKHVRSLEAFLITLLKAFNIPAQAHAEKIGIWTDFPNQRPEKIASIGIQVRKWIASHGVALNVSNDLEPFKKIIPCGLENDRITSMQTIRPEITYNDVVEKALELGRSFLKNGAVEKT